MPPKKTKEEWLKGLTPQEQALPEEELENQYQRYAAQQQEDKQAPVAEAAPAVQSPSASEQIAQRLPNVPTGTPLTQEQIDAQFEANAAGVNDEVEETEPEKLEQALGTQIAQQARNDEQYNSDWRQYVKDQQELIKQREEEDQAEIQRKRKASQWTGLTGLATAMVNLFGTMHGAASQKQSSPANTWMQQAEALTRESRQRIRAAQDSVRAQEQAYNREKLQRENALGRMRAEAAVKVSASKERYAKSQLEMLMSKDLNAARIRQINSSIAQIDMTNQMNRERIVAQLAARGLKLNPQTGEAEVDETLMKAAKELRASSTKKGTTSTEDLLNDL